MHVNNRMFAYDQTFDLKYGRYHKIKLPYIWRLSTNIYEYYNFRHRPTHEWSSRFVTKERDNV